VDSVDAFGHSARTGSGAFGAAASSPTTLGVWKLPIRRRDRAATETLVCEACKACRWRGAWQWYAGHGMRRSLQPWMPSTRRAAPTSCS
jgi:hypothetical protein